MENQWMTMGMVAKLCMVQDKDTEKVVDKIKRLFERIDNKFSTYKETSVISQYRRGEVTAESDAELGKILKECERTRKETNGYFDCNYAGKCDPSGLVKGYAISQAAKLLDKLGKVDYLIEIAGDLQTHGYNEDCLPWKIGIENPFKPGEIVKVVNLSGRGLATSGTSVHKDHIIDPKRGKPANEIASVTVIADDVYDCDRMATAAFAMGKQGIEFIQSLNGYYGYMITNDGQGIMTEGFEKYV